MRCGILVFGRGVRFAGCLCSWERDPSLSLLLQFVSQCEEGEVEFTAAVECVWAVS